MASSRAAGSEAAGGAASPPPPPPPPPPPEVKKKSRSSVAASVDVDDAGAARNVSGDAEADTVDGVRPLLHRPRYDGFCDG